MNTSDKIWRLDYDLLRETVDELSTAIVNRIDRDQRPHVAALHPGLPAILKLTTRTSAATWASIRHLAGSGKENQPGRPELIVSISPLARTILDSLFTIVLLLDKPSENTRWYYASGWREARDHHGRLLQKHGTDPVWRNWLDGHEQMYVNGWETDAQITPEEKGSPGRVKWWPNPGRMVNQVAFVDQNRKAFLEFLNDWFYKNLSGDSHLSLLGLARRAGHLFDYGGVAHSADILSKYRGQVTLDALTLFIALLSEIAGQFRFSLESKRLYETWACIDRWDNARELYEKRYRSWLSPER